MCPVAIEVFCVNTADPATLASQIRKLRERFGLARVVLVTARGILIQVQIDQVRDIKGFGWITALRFPSIARLRDRGVFQASLFETKNLAGITSPDSPGERLVCRNPVRAGSGFRPSAGFRRSVLSGGAGDQGFHLDPDSIRHLLGRNARPYLLRFGLKTPDSPKESLSNRIHGIHIHYLRISSRLSQREAAKKPGITQPRLNERLQGKLQTFSLVARVKMISKVGIPVDVHVIVA